MMYKNFKLGFIGLGNMSQTIIKGLIESKVLHSSQIFASNRSVGKLERVSKHYNINACHTNEDVVDSSDVIIIATKPQDYSSALDPLISTFRENQIVISLAAGITFESLKKNYKIAEL